MPEQTRVLDSIRKAVWGIYALLLVQCVGLGVLIAAVLR